MRNYQDFSKSFIKFKIYNELLINKKSLIDLIIN